MADTEDNISNGNGEHAVLDNKSIPTEILKKEFLDTPVESDSSDDEAVAPTKKFDTDLTSVSTKKNRTFDTSLDDDDVKVATNGNSSDRELKKLKRVIEELEDELADVEDEKKDLRRKLTSTEEELSRAALTVAERDDECAALKRDLDRWRARVAEESQRRTALEGQMKGREEKWAAVESNAAEVTYLEGKLAEARVEIKKLHDELAAAREERDKMAESVKETGRGSTETSRKLQREIEALKLRHETELTLLRQELDEQHDLAQKSIDQLRSKFKAQLVTVTAQSEESRGDEAEFRRVKRKLDREVHDLSEKLESERMERGKDLRTIESLTRLNKTLREKLDKLTLDKDNLDESKFKLESEVKDLLAKLEIAEKQRTYFQEQVHHLRFDSTDTPSRSSSKVVRSEPQVEVVHAEEQLVE